MTRRFYIYTIGCQMNVLDSELVAAALREAGYEPTDRSGRAQIVLLNTCSVRQHAEDKIYSLLGRLKAEKLERPEMVIGVLGCMAQKDQHEILRRAPHVDLVVGPGQLGRLPEMLKQITDGQGPLIEVSIDRRAADRATIAQSFTAAIPDRIHRRPAPRQAMVRAMLGCDKFCTYCIVPHVRGPEQSRPATEILEEVRRLADDGCLEVTLLGQTVNSYRDTSGPTVVELADLLYRVHEIDGIRRIKFVTNHPRHMTDALIQAVRDLPKVSPYFHAPAQSGSNAVLRRMKRGYTVEQYRDMLSRIREAVPQAAVTSDFIVGFCGETEEEFQETAALVRDGRFKNSFIFKYSGRPGTKAAELYADDVTEAVKRRRNNELLDIQNAISLEDNQPYLGRTVEILVEGPSKAAKKKENCKMQNANCKLQNEEHKTAAFDSLATGHRPPATSSNPQSLIPNPPIVQLVGRTTCDRIVVFEGPATLTGRILPVEIEKIDAFTLFGRLLECGNSLPLSGESG